MPRFRRPVRSSQAVREAALLCEAPLRVHTPVDPLRLSMSSHRKSPVLTVTSGSMHTEMRTAGRPCTPCQPFPTEVPSGTTSVSDANIRSRCVWPAVAADCCTEVDPASHLGTTSVSDANIRSRCVWPADVPQVGVCM